MKKSVHGVPFTGSTPQMRPKPPVKTSTHTSADAERIIKRPPMPFSNPQNITNLPVSDVIASSDTDYKGPSKAKIGTTVGARSLPSGAAVGQKRPINQSGQVFGRMGTSHPKKSGNPVAGQRSHRNAAFFGER